MSRSLLIPAVVGVGVLGMVIGFVLTGGVGLIQDESPKVYYVDSAGKLCESRFTLNQLARTVGSKQGLTTVDGKPTLAGESLEFTFSRMPDGSLRVERLVSAQALPDLPSAPWGKNTKPVLQPDRIIPMLGK